jgi:hypothetical protein
LRERQASRQQRACFVPMKVSLSVLASASLSGATTKRNQSECRRPRTLADLAPTGLCRRPPARSALGAGNACHPLPGWRHCILRCLLSRSYAAGPLRPSASVISTLTTALLEWSPDQKGSV